ncbi:MAG: hypothetical protein QXU74_02335 [Candidatus Aenigmatarchaeota archaeon]
MLEELRKGFLILIYPLPTLFLLVYAGEEKAVNILKEHSDTYYQFYRSNRLRGYGIKTSVERSIAGYGCFKGFRAKQIDKVGILHHLI